MTEKEITLDEALHIPPQAEVVEIKSVMKTPGSDRLHNFGVHGWTVISSNINQTEESFGEPRYQVGDKVIYIAIDSVLPSKLESWLFPEGSKITLDGGRVKTLKLRGAISQGMLVDFDKGLRTLYPDISEASAYRPGTDLTKTLGIVKFEPPASSVPSAMRGQQAKRNPFFKEYTDIRNLKHYADTDVLQEGELVYVSAKLHGTSARYAMLPTHVPALPKLTFKTYKEFWEILVKKVKHKLGLLEKYEYCFGSRRVQLQDKPKDHKTFYAENVYHKVGETYNLKDKLQPGEELFVEIVGKGIQKYYDYNVPEGKYEYYAYDIMKDGMYLHSADFKAVCDLRGISRVPDLGYVLYNMDALMKLATAKTCLNGQKVREGVVVKPVEERSHPGCGRVALKLINPEYLLKDNSDFH